MTSPDSKINNLALFISWNGMTHPFEVKGCITDLLRSSMPQSKFNLTFPNLAYRTQEILDYLEHYQNLSPWEVGLNILDLGSDLKSVDFQYEFLDIFPNIHTSIGVPFQIGSFYIVKLLTHFLALYESTRLVDIQFKCQPRYEDEEEYKQAPGSPSSMAFQSLWYS
jgi:hypothetical protein